MLRHITPWASLFFLVACTTSEDNNTSDTNQFTDNQTNKKAHMLSDQERMIQKANDAEELVNEAAKKQKKAIDDASQ